MEASPFIFENEKLSTLSAKITRALDLMPTTNPLTLVDASETFDENKQVRSIVAHHCHELDAETRTRIENEYFAAGPIEPLFQDPEVTEIIVNGGDSIWFEKKGFLHRLEDRFLTPITYRNFIARLSREAGIQANLDCPFADGHWRGCRLHLIIPPASGEQAVLTLRRHPANPWTLNDLVDKAWASKSDMYVLKTLVDEKKNVLIVGCTGSGKTSVLNACMGLLPASERVVIIEDTNELSCPNRASSKLLTRQDPHGQLREINQTELLRQALRMRPDRIVMGEIRGGEAKDLLMAFATGHTGCMGTLHADSARQALLRLEMLIQLGAPQWNLQAVRSLILLSVQAIVVVGRDREGVRRLEGIYKVMSLEDVGFLLEKMT